ncbi:exp1-like protein [Podochytrium sp. JEL0797]|nr:exp1-like protein [Podochytrium sp. JEL0797]
MTGVSRTASFATTTATATATSAHQKAARKKLKALASPSVAAPKMRAKSSYLLFADDARAKVSLMPHIAALDPKKKLPAVAKEIGNMWRVAGSQDKDKYELLAKRAKAEHDAEIKAYLVKRTPNDILIEEKMRALKQTIRPKATLPKLRKDPTAPTRPLSAYTLYMLRSGAVKARDMKGGAAKWKAMSDKEKEPYVEEAAKLKVAYAAEKERYLARTGIDELRKTMTKELNQAVKKVGRAKRSVTKTAKKVVKKPTKKVTAAKTKKPVAKKAAKKVVKKVVKKVTAVKKSVVAKKAPAKKVVKNAA